MRTSSGFTVTSEIIIALFHFFKCLEWTVYEIFFFRKVFQKRRRKKKIHPRMISHIKNISMGLWLHKKRKTHIQYPNIYKLYVSINYIYTKKDFFFFFLHNILCRPGNPDVSSTV